MITITELANEKVKDVIEAQNIPDDRFLRVGIAGGGCSGLRYGLVFDNEFDALTDTRYEAATASRCTHTLCEHMAAQPSGRSPILGTDMPL